MKAQEREELNALYVAMTRARERLFLSWSARRVMQGREFTHLLSPFLKEILPWHGGHWPVTVKPETNGEAIIYYSPEAPGESMQSAKG